MKQRTLFNIKPAKSPDRQVKEVTGTKLPHKPIKRDASHYRNYEPIYCKIQQRRLQMLIHSCIYYEFNTSIITDSKFDTWARELVQLQKTYPEQSKQVPWYNEFKEWDGTTGYHLPLRDPWVLSQSTKLLVNKGEIQ